MARQHGDVFEALAQRRQTQANHVEAVKQVLAEGPVLDALLQVLMRGRNHAHIRFHGRVTAHAVKMAVAQDPQQAGLQVKRHVADLVQKQGATVGLLEAAAAHGLRARKRTALVPEQLGLQQVLGNGRGIDRHKRAGGPRRVLVQGARDKLLARARLAGDHDRDIALAQAANGAKHVLHGRGLPQHFGRFRHALLGHLFAQAFLDRAANQLDRLGQIKGLGQVFKRAPLKRRHRTVQVGIGGHDDHGQTRIFFLHFFKQVQARAARHADVADQHLGSVIVRGDLQGVEDIARIGEAARGHVFTQQRFLQHEPDGLVIVYDPNRLHIGGTSGQALKSTAYGSGINNLKSVWPGTLSHSIKPWCCCTKVCANVSPSPEPPSRPETSG